MKRPTLSAVGKIVRRHDPDRYFTALFAPVARREALFTLYAFNHELARAREVAREPMMALIRLQWWREVLEGARRQHEVAGPLGVALDTGALRPSDLEPMLAAREMEAEPIETMRDFDAYVHGAAGALMVSAARVLGMEQPEPMLPWGAAVGVAGVLRNLPAFARQGRCVLPLDLLADCGLTPGQVITDPARASAAVRTRLIDRATTWLTARPDVPTTAIAAALPVLFARRDLARPIVPRERGLGDKLAVTLAALAGRLSFPPAFQGAAGSR